MNYEQLEESLSLDELLETYAAMVELRIEDKEFQAKIMGAEFKSKSDQRPSEESSSSSPPLAERLRQKVNTQNQNKAITSGSFSEGVGYRVIG